MQVSIAHTNPTCTAHRLNCDEDILKTKVFRSIQKVFGLPCSTSLSFLFPLTSGYCWWLPDYSFFIVKPKLCSFHLYSILALCAPCIHHLNVCQTSFTSVRALNTAAGWSLPYFTAVMVLQNIPILALTLAFKPMDNM